MIARLKMNIYAYHYPGLEFIFERREHWEMNLALPEIKKLYPQIELWPPNLTTVEKYILNRNMLAFNTGINGFLHFWYPSVEYDYMNATAKLICMDNMVHIPIAIALCWKLPHIEPLSTCVQHKLVPRCDLRESIHSFDDIVREIRIIANNLMASKNYIKIGSRPILLLYHLEGWNAIFTDFGISLDAIRSEFLKYGINPFIIAISIEPDFTIDIYKATLFDGITRYNDLADFTGSNFQEFRKQSNEYMNRWPILSKLAYQNNFIFIPCVSIGWNAQLRYNRKSIDKTKIGYPLFPIVSNPTKEDIIWVLDRAINHSLRNSLNYLFVCAWNEWTENAALEYFSTYNNFQISSVTN